MNTYQHAWPIKDDSLRATELAVIALDDLDDRILPEQGLTRTTFPDFSLRPGTLIATCGVEHTQAVAA